MNRPEIGISRRYLHDEVVARLRKLILEGDLEPGARINEPELADRFRISRTPLREAVKILATEGLLELLPNRGARVSRMSEEEIDEMVEVVAGLEATAADLACRRITPAEIDAIEAMHLAMMKAFESRDDARYFALNRDIHDAIMAAARNGTLASIYCKLSGRIQRARYSAHKTPEQWRRAIDEHERMIVLLRDRNGDALSRVMREHIRGKKPIIAAAYGNGVLIRSEG
jgi:DNA-binding GntR family transcriptional regulator